MQHPGDTEPVSRGELAHIAFDLILCADGGLAPLFAAVRRALAGPALHRRGPQLRAGAARGASAQPTRTSTRRGLACSSFGMRSVRTPSFSPASIAVLSSSALSSKLRR